MSALLLAGLAAAGVGATAWQTRATAATAAPSASSSMTARPQTQVSAAPTPHMTPETASALVEVVPAAYGNLSRVDGTAALATAGVDLNEMQRSRLMAGVEEFRAQGYQASFVIVDMGSGAVISSYGGEPMYTASSIKAPYVVSLAQTGAIDLDAVAAGSTVDGAALNRLITQTLQISDNDAYDALYERFGAAPAVDWLAETGASAGLNGYYADVTPVDMARMWVHTYQYLFGDDDLQSRAWLAQQMRGSLNSSIDAARGEDEVVYSKAGWIYGEGGLYAYNDAGIVLPTDASRLAERPQGYVLVMMTNACGRDDLMTGFAQTVDEAMRAA